MRPGVFEAYAVDHEYSTSSNGNVQIRVRFHMPSEDSYIAWYGTFTDKARQYTLAALAAAGWDGADLDALEGLGSVPCDLVLAEDTYNGKTSIKVKFVNGRGANAPQSKGALDADGKRRFLADMRGHLAAWNKERGAQPKPASQKKRPDDDDGIPF